jgi:DNA-binding MarR family transcriptional regulator
MTTIVRLVERDGLVERRADEHDRRAMRVHLTAKGRRFKPVAARVLTELNGLADGALGERSVSATERALAELANLKGQSL